MPDVARRVARWGIYYGWVIVAVLMLVGFVRAGFTGFLFGIFLKPMSEDLGWSRAQITGAVSVGTLAGGFAALIIGRWLDQYGPRRIYVVAAAIMGLAFLGLSRVNSLATFYLLYIVGRTLSQSVLHDGMGATVVSKWFIRRRARAISLVAIGGPAAGATLIVVSQAVISSHDWRAGWLALGIIALSLFLLPAFLFLRRLPEDLGLRPDGDPPQRPPAPTSPAGAPETRPAPVATEEYSWRLSAALRTRAFWVLSASGALGNLIGTSLAFHMVPYFTDVGISATVAVTALTVYTITGAASTLLWGLTAERIGVQRAILVAIGILIVAIALFLVTRTSSMAFVTAVAFGVGQVGLTMLMYALWAIYFGRKYLGSIQGVGLLFQQVGNAAGPLFAAVVFDITDSYSVAFRTDLALGVVIFVLLLLAGRPVPRDVSRTEAGPS